MKCPSCSRRDGTHTDGCKRPAPKPGRVAKPTGPEVHRFQVDLRPINATAYSLLAELHESWTEAA